MPTIRLPVPRWRLDVWWDRLRLWKWDVPQIETATLTKPEVKFEAISLERYAVIEKWYYEDEMWFTIWDHEEDKQIAVKAMNMESPYVN